MLALGAKESAGGLLSQSWLGRESNGVNGVGIVHRAHSDRNKGRQDGPRELFHSDIYEILTKSCKFRVLTALDGRSGAFCPLDFHVLSLVGQAQTSLSVCTH